jgi:long-chain acyl-CoA synthetase/feruloyl-CoA synthase
MDWSQHQIPPMRLEARFGDRLVPAFCERPRTVWQMVADAAARNPDGEALVCGARRLTWREIAKASAEIAAGLRANGLQRGDRVALLLGNRIEFPLLLFAAAHLGLITVLLGTRQQKPEIAYVLNDCGAKLLIHEVALADRVPEARDIPQLVHRIAVDDDPRRSQFAGIADHAALAAPADVDEEDTAMILYTSGTTGMPKGVLVPEGNLADAPGQVDLGQVLGAMFGESLLHAVPLFGFTGCHGLMLLSIRAGITQIVLPRFDPEQLLAAIERHRATSIMGVPTMLNLAMKHPKVGDHDYNSLQLVFSGAAPIQPDTVRKMRQVWPGAKMLNAYSLTEAGAAAACMLGPDPDDILSRPGSVGRPVGCAVVVVDDHDNPLPSGKVGEICFTSKTTRRSYYKGEQSTAQLWRGELLHTGDVGYVSDDGYVYLTDRKKDMILRGGYNIFAIEVERVLLEMPEVLEAAVIAVPHPDLGEDLLAVIAPKPGFSGGEGELTAERINQFCRQYLADYKCPRHMVVVDELPKNAMAKVMKNELRQRFRDHLVDQGTGNKMNAS